ncbi:MAG: M56 family metallopeptidase [bacterium]|nr:M56 family metallopeptidase [bacterium]
MMLEQAALGLHELAWIWASHFPPLCWKGALLIGVCWLMTRVIRRGSSAERHLIWTTGAVALLLLPVLSVWLTTWRSSSLPSSPSVDDDCRRRALVHNVPSVADNDPMTQQVLLLTDDAVHAESLDSVLLVSDSCLDSRAEVPFLIWLSGVALTATIFICGQVGVRRLARRARPLTDPDLMLLAATLARHMGLSRPVRFLSGDTDQMPLTWGVWRSAILLPAGCEHWDRDRLRDVLLHELAHVQRRDTLTQAVAHLACILFWFNPMLWFMVAGMRLEREQACDDRVLAQGIPPCDYAAHLVAVTRELHASRRLIPAGPALTGPRQLTQRVDALLEEERSRRCPDRRGTLFIAAVGATMLLFLAGMGPVVAGNRHQATTARAVRAVPVAVDTILVNMPGAGLSTVLVADIESPLPHSDKLEHLDRPSWWREVSATTDP